MNSQYKFIDADGDVLEIGLNHSFGHPSITLYAEAGVRMTVEDTENLIEELKKVIDKVKNEQKDL